MTPYTEKEKFYRIRFRIDLIEKKVAILNRQPRWCRFAYRCTKVVYDANKLYTKQKFQFIINLTKKKTQLILRSFIQNISWKNYENFKILPARIQQNKCPNIKSATTSALQKFELPSMFGVLTTDAIVARILTYWHLLNDERRNAL